MKQKRVKGLEDFYHVNDALKATSLRVPLVGVLVAAFASKKQKFNQRTQKQFSLQYKSKTPLSLPCFTGFWVKKLLIYH
jgi:hypothetical protein